MITNILAYIDGHSSVENAAEAACQLAIRHNAHVEGLFVRTDARDFITNAPIYSGIESLEKFVQSFDRASEQREKRATDAFAQVRDRLGVSETKPAKGRPTADWTAVSGQPQTIVCHHARVADVCVIGRGSNGRKNTTTPVIEAALFDTGRPVLVAPPQPPASVGGDVDIAWNRSAAAARALSMAMPLFDKADRIRLVYVETGAKQGPSAEEAAAYVERHGFAVEVKTVAPHREGVGTALLRYAQTQNSSLLVMGAYSHSRLREIVLGGVTRHVLENATMPVLMVH
jgi:nucleotide-binding universal stress UspA family protein